MDFFVVVFNFEDKHNKQLRFQILRVNSIPILSHIHLRFFYPLMHLKDTQRFAHFVQCYEKKNKIKEPRHQRRCLTGITDSKDASQPIKPLCLIKVSALCRYNLHELMIL